MVAAYNHAIGGCKSNIKKLTPETSDVSLLQFWFFLPEMLFFGGLFKMRETMFFYRVVE